MEKLSREQLQENKTLEVKARQEQLKERYKVRGFLTTSESITYTQKMGKAISKMKVNIEDIKDTDVSEMFDFFDPELVKYIVSTFVSIKKGDKEKAMNYESEFIGEFETLMMVFVMAIEHLSQKANGKGKQKAQIESKIISTKRASNL